jgi:predicted phage terminase large subunit-like protein
VRARRAELIRERTARDASLIRERCKSFDGFVREAWPILEPTTRLIWNWHLDAMCEHAQAITFGQLEPRLVCNVPPGSSKSTIFTVMWQAWEWGPCDLPGNKFLSTSFELGNVTRDTRKTRDLILSEWFQMLWPRPLKRAGETSFENEQRGTREGVAFVSLTAKRGDRLVIDDPHSLDGAESEAERDKATRRFIEGGQNRLNDQLKSAIVIVMQRLHERDLSGVVLARDMGFTHLLIPMEFEPERRIVTPIGWTDPRTLDGELMDPRRMPEKALKPLRDSEYSYAGQYQQRPAPREGGLFKVDKIEIVEPGDVPIGGQIVRGWDLAATSQAKAGSKRKTSARTAGVRIKRAGGMLYIENAKAKRLSPNEVEQLILATTIDESRSVLQSLPQDPGQAGLAQKLRYAELLEGHNFRITPEVGTKEERAIPFAAQIEAGRVRLVRGDWNAAYLDELRNFPNGALKDQVDASTRAFQELLKADKHDGIFGASQLIEPAGATL